MDPHIRRHPVRLLHHVLLSLVLRLLLRTQRNLWHIPVLPRLPRPSQAPAESA